MSNKEHWDYMYNYDIHCNKQIFISSFRICQHLCMLAESGDKEPQNNILSVT